MRMLMPLYPCAGSEEPGRQVLPPLRLPSGGHAKIDTTRHASPVSLEEAATAAPAGAQQAAHSDSDSDSGA